MSRTRNRSYLIACRDPHVWRRALLLGLPVGVAQATLNQGDHWWNHHVDAVVVAKTILSPLLSCAIAFVSAVTTQVSRSVETTSA